MPNLTVRISGNTCRNARIWCAQNNSPASGVVRDILNLLLITLAAKTASILPQAPQPKRETPNHGLKTVNCQTGNSNCELSSAIRQLLPEIQKLVFPFSAVFL